MSKTYNKNIASLKTIVHDTTVLDAQKILIKPANSVANERANILDVINDSTTTINERLETVENEIIGTFTTGAFDTNTVNGTLDNATVTGIQYSKAHFINDARILSISIPFTALSNVTNQGHLCIQVYDQSENIISTGYSNNKVSYNTATLTEAVYTFNEFYIPKDYKIIRLSLVSNTSVIPDVTNNTNVLSYRARPIKFNNSFTFDDDECQVYNGTSTNNWLIAATISYNKGTLGVIQKFDTVQNNVSELENRIVELENKKIPTMTYDSINVVSTLTEQPTNSGDLNAVIFNSAKIPHNIPISAIEIPIAGNTTSEPLYLVAYNVTENNTRSLIARSTNSIVPASGINAIWQFEESFTILDGYSLAIYIAKENSSIGNSEVNLTDTHIRCPQLNSGTDTIRYAAGTYNRDVFVKIHTVNSIPLNDKIDDIISTSNTHITKDVADETYLKVNGSNKIAGHIHVDDSSLNTFTIGYPWADKIGALLSLRSVNYETDGQQGTFAVGAINGENEKFLVGYPDGKLTWNGKNILTDESAGGFIGEIKFSSYDSVPSGYLICDGSKISRTTYSALFKVIGTKWGAGDGSTTFALPNLIDKVAWGAKTAGAYKNAGLPNITGKTGIFENYLANNLSSSGALFYSQYPDKLSVGGGGSGWYYYVNIDASKSNAIYGKSSTVQPPAATVVPIIRYI